MTPSGIESATFRLVTQCLYSTAVFTVDRKYSSAVKANKTKTSANTALDTETAVSTFFYINHYFISTKFLLTLLISENST
jgi:hypothetical protein